MWHWARTARVRGLLETRTIARRGKRKSVDFLPSAGTGGVVKENTILRKKSWKEIHYHLTAKILSILLLNPVITPKYQAPVLLYTGRVFP